MGRVRWQRLPVARAVLAVLAASALSACDGAPEREATAGSPNAKPGFRRLQDEDRSVGRHAADGAGRAWLEEPAGQAPVEAGTAHRLPIVFEAGEAGIAPGGAVVLQISPHWGWSRPQLEDPEAPGYTTVETPVAGVSLAPRLEGRWRVVVEVSGRALVAGDRVRIVYGAGPERALVDQYAESDAPIWIGVDGDGDGWWSLLPDPPRIDIVASPPAGLVLLLPSTARPGEPIDLTAAVLDAHGDAVSPVAIRVGLRSQPAGLAVPEELELHTEDSGRRTVTLSAPVEGTYRVRGTTVLDGRLRIAESNPMVVSSDVPRLLWGDLHGHSQLSDGTGTPADYFRYARDVSALDVASLTDHDRWGVRFLDTNPLGWKAVQGAVREFNEPGRFVALLGYEWTNWMRGHRHVLYFDDEGTIHSATDPDTDEASELWAALAGQPALTFAHHPAGEPVAVDWEVLPDPDVEPVVEIASLHGSSESAETSYPVKGGIQGHFVRDVLDRGARLGFIGSGDSHNGHPGLAHLTADRGAGLAAIFSEERTRDGVYEALRARRVYATNGPRIFLYATLDGRPMGSSVPAAPGGGHRLAFQLASELPLVRVDRIRSDGRIESLEAQGRREWSWEGLVPDLSPGEYLYLRAVQEDGGTAWSSPFFAE